ncbi:MAG: hypothetical protein AAGI63_05225 [Planctomycetota bacterium]
MHSKSSAKKFGGEPSDYIEIHNWLDQTKAHFADLRHRAILHSSFGIFLCEQVFGVTIERKSDGKSVPLRPIAEQHIFEDLGKIPSIQDWIADLPLKDWMVRGARSLKTFDEEERIDSKPSQPEQTDPPANAQTLTSPS